MTSVGGTALLKTDLSLPSPTGTSDYEARNASTAGWQIIVFLPFTTEGSLMWFNKLYLFSAVKGTFEKFGLGAGFAAEVSFAPQGGALSVFLMVGGTSLSTTL